jgi:hypothetical protein
MIHDLTIFAITFASTVVGCRMAYDCWPWEWTKTSHYTRTIVRDHLGYTDEESRRL